MDKTDSQLPPDVTSEHQPVIDSRAGEQKTFPYPGITHLRKLHVLSIFSMLIVFVGLVVGVVMMNKSQEIRKRASGNGVALSLVPATETIAPNQEFIEAITANTNDQNMSAAELHLTYDPAKLEAVKIEAGTFLPVVLTPGAVGGGTASITLGSQPTAPPKGSGILASVTFKLRTNTATDVAFADTTQVAVIGRTDNAVGTKTGAHVTTPTNTPTPTTHTTSTPTPTSKPTTTPTPTQKPSGTPTATPTPTGIPTPTPTTPITSTNTPTPMHTSTPTPTQPFNPIAFILPTATPTPTPTITAPLVGFSQIGASPTPQPTVAPVPPTANVPSTNLIVRIFIALVNFFQCTIFGSCPAK